MRLLGSDVRCVRGGREVFAGLSFQAAAGEAVAVTGRNGSGKTSLLRLIAGLLLPAGGSIAIEGGETELTVAEQAHYLGHRDALKPALSVNENLSFWSDFLGGGAARPAADCLAAVGLPHARLLAVARPLWLLDEPTNALDVAGQAMFADLMRAHLAGGGLIIAATHGPLGIDARELRIGGMG